MYQVCSWAATIPDVGIAPVSAKNAVLYSFDFFHTVSWRRLRVFFAFIFAR